MEQCDDYYGCDDDNIIVTPRMALKKVHSEDFHTFYIENNL